MRGLCKFHWLFQSKQYHGIWFELIFVIGVFVNCCLEIYKYILVPEKLSKNNNMKKWIMSKIKKKNQINSKIYKERYFLNVKLSTVNMIFRKLHLFIEIQLAVGIQLFIL